MWFAISYCITCVRCPFTLKELATMVRLNSVVAKKRSWGPHEKSFILSGCFPFKTNFFKWQEKPGNWKELNPENETTILCQYVRMKFVRVEENRTWYWMPFLWWPWPQFVLNTVLGQPKMTAKMFTCHAGKIWGKWALILIKENVDIQRRILS